MGKKCERSHEGKYVSEIVQPPRNGDMTWFGLADEHNILFEVA
jgi:hypothetical protein